MPTDSSCNNDRGTVLETITLPDGKKSPGPENYRQINELLKNKNKTVASTKNIDYFSNYKSKLRIQFA